MASSSTFCNGSFLLFLVASFAVVQMAMAGDPDILTDFIAKNLTGSLDGNFFTYTGMRVLVNAPPPLAFKVMKASMAEFPALNGQSVSFAALQFPNGTANPPHTHPRASELLFLLEGTLVVGFVDTTNKLFIQTLQSLDMFVFPKGLIHFQYNAHPVKPVLAVSAFGSANAGTVSIPNTLFTTNVADNILAESFKTDIPTIQKIKAGLAPKP